MPVLELETYSDPEKVYQLARELFGEDVQIKPSTKKNKKYMIMNPDGKWISFGQVGYEDYTKHLDDKRKASYLKRTARKGTGDNDPYSANNLSKNLLWGSGFSLKKVLDIGLKGVGGLKSPATRIADVKALLQGRNDYPPKVRDLLAKYGDEVLVTAMVRRAPVQSALITALNVLSLGEFKKRLKDTPYDSLFHLQFYFTTESGKKFTVEKNEVINMDINPKTQAKTETEDIIIPANSITINDLMNNTKACMGKKMFGYSAKDNNCQDFVICLLKGNNLGNEIDLKFVKQDTEQLFTGMDTLRKITNTATDLGATLNIATTGAGLDPTSSEILKHLISHIIDPKEPVDKRDYSQAKKLIDDIMKEKQTVGKGMTYKEMKASKKPLPPWADEWISGNGLAKDKISPNNKMANKWITHVKDFATKNGMSYRDALRDPKCKASYKTGKGLSDEECEGGGLPVTHQDGTKTKYIAFSGKGVIDELASQRILSLADRLGQNAGKKFISL
jgi:hypothetical protein